jgi:hypothetical protein
MTRQRFLYHLSHASYRKNWGKQYQQPTFGERFLTFLIRILPKVGPLRALSFRMPTPDAEKLFMASFNEALSDYQHFDGEVRNGTLMLENDNFDTGTVTHPGEYPLADSTYADLVDRLAKDHFAQVSPELREDILSYFHDTNAPFAFKKNKKQWTRVLAELNDLKTANQTQSAETANGGDVVN